MMGIIMGTTLSNQESSSGCLRRYAEVMKVVLDLDSEWRNFSWESHLHGRYTLWTQMCM